MQIWVGAAKAARRYHILVEGGVDIACVVSQLRQRLNIRVLQLRQLAVALYQPNNRVMRPELIQFLLARRVTRLALLNPRRWQLEFHKERLS